MAGQGAGQRGAHAHRVGAAHVLIALRQGELLAESAVFIHLESAPEEAGAIRRFEMQLQLAVLRVRDAVERIHRAQVTAHINLLAGAVEAAVGPEHGAELAALGLGVEQGVLLPIVRKRLHHAVILAMLQEHIALHLRQVHTALLHHQRLLLLAAQAGHHCAIHRRGIAVAQHQRRVFVLRGADDAQRQIRNIDEHIPPQHQLLRLQPQAAGRGRHRLRGVEIQLQQVEARLGLLPAE